MLEEESLVRETFIDSREVLDEYFGALKSGDGYEACAVDTEADSMHSYETKLCLIQFAVPDSLAIIDPLEIGKEKLEPFLDFVRKVPVIWMHGADYDMSMMRQTFGWVPETVWDTQTAARLLGVRKYGLANLLEDEFGVVVSKQSQKADWSRRPLTPKMQAYAFNDVRYLLELGNRYVESLKNLGRFDWFVESCDMARLQVLDRDEKCEDTIWRISGWGKLNRKGLHYLKALWAWRDSECEKLDRPAFKFLGNQELLDLARDLQEDRVPKPPHFLRPPFVRRLRQAIDRAKEDGKDESKFPVKFRRTGGKRLEINESRFQSLRSRRDKVAEELDIEAPLIATRTILEQLASDNLEEDEKLESLMTWQKDLLLG